MQWCLGFIPTPVNRFRWHKAKYTTTFQINTLVIAQLCTDKQCRKIITKTRLIPTFLFDHRQHFLSALALFYLLCDSRMLALVPPDSRICLFRKSLLVRSAACRPLCSPESHTYRWKLLAYVASRASLSRPNACSIRGLLQPSPSTLPGVFFSLAQRSTALSYQRHLARRSRNTQSILACSESSSPSGKLEIPRVFYGLGICTLVVFFHPFL